MRFLLYTANTYLVLAGRIVDWREQHGPFVEVGQLREVAGIGEKTFQSLSELVTV